MKERLKYFIFNKTQDYLGGYLENMECDRDGIWIRQTGQNSRGTFISRILDSREKDMEWHRMTFDVSSENGAPYKITVFASNSTGLNDGKQPADLNLLIRDTKRTFDEKLERMEPFIKKQETKGRDILLYGVIGRYLWIAVELFGRGGQEMKLEHIKLYFPKQSWLNYLPELYQSNDAGRFLERYLAVFQTLHESMNQRIREVPDMIDVDLAGKELLVCLSQWLHIAGSYMWSEEQLRKLLKNGIRLYKKRGTREGILEFIRLYTGGEAYLVEFYQVEPYMADKRLKESLSKLYGVSPCTFSVILKKEYVPTQKDYKSLVRVIDEIKPAQMEADLVILEPYMFLGSHVYMGINSAFGEYKNLTLDGLSMIPFSTIHSAGHM
jgi:phage tail-like protein